MSVEQGAFIPKVVDPLDPKQAEEKKADPNYWARKAEEAKARHDYMEYEHAIEMMNSGGKEPPFQIKGSINLGEFNPQQAAKETQDRMDKLMADKDKQIEAERKRAEDAEAKLHQEELSNLRHDLTNQMSDLQKTIERIANAKNTQDAGSLNDQFMKQYESAMQIAKTLAPEKTIGGQNPVAELELKKIEMTMGREDREFKWKMHQDDRQWEIEKIKLSDEHNYRKAQLDQEDKKMEMLASIPETIGGAIAKAVTDKGAAAGIAGRGGAPVNQAYRVDIEEGQTGTIDCPNCKTQVGIGPTQDQAQCVKCGAPFMVARRSKGQPPAPPQSESEKIKYESEDV